MCRFASTWSVLCLILFRCNITVQATVTLVSQVATKRIKRHTRRSRRRQSNDKDKVSVASWRIGNSENHNKKKNQEKDPNTSQRTSKGQGMFSSGDSFECVERRHVGGRNGEAIRQERKHQRQAYFEVVQVE